MGNDDAQFRLGLIYAAGQEVQRDVAKAVTWFRKAAEQGNSAAQFNLAVFLAQGVGVPQDYTPMDWGLRRIRGKQSNGIERRRLKAT